MVENFDFGSPEQRLAIQGRDERSKINIAKLSLYQGTTEEQEQYGDGFKRGEWLDTLAVKSLGEKVCVLFVPGLMTAQYAIWEKGKRVPTASWDNAASVPKELLEPSTLPDGTWVPPQAQEAISCVVCVEGQDWPYLLVFKKTSLKCFNKRIMPMEAQLASANQPPGMYEMSSVDDKNAAGQGYKRVTAKYVGRPTQKMLELAKVVFSRASKYKQAARELQEEHVEIIDGE